MDMYVCIFICQSHDGQWTIIFNIVQYVVYIFLSQHTDNNYINFFISYKFRLLIA